MNIRLFLPGSGSAFTSRTLEAQAVGGYWLVPQIRHRPRGCLSALFAVEGFQEFA
jgi:hypothetical protein